MGGLPNESMLTEQWEHLPKKRPFNTRRHLSYLKYILQHKWFVLIAGIKIGCPIYLLLLHDISKFYPSEWFAYAHAFYKPDGTKRYSETNEFNRAWLFHQHRNPHHWQYWQLKQDEGGSLPLPIPKKYILEMLADWMGAGRAIHGKWEYKEWYIKNKEKIQLEPYTRRDIENVIRR